MSLCVCVRDRDVAMNGHASLIYPLCYVILSNMYVQCLLCACLDALSQNNSLCLWSIMHVITAFVGCINFQC